MSDNDIDLDEFLSFARGLTVNRLIELMDQVKIPDLTVLEILDIVAALASDELEPEIEADDTGHYRVTFELAPGKVWLEPNDARYVAHQLAKAADEAAEKNRMSAR